MSNNTKELIFEKEVAPLLDQLTDLCEKHDFPMIVAVQLYTSPETGARIAAQSVETPETAIHLLASSNILRGKARLTIESDRSFYVTLSDAEGNYEEQFETETLAEHADHCEGCRASLEERRANGEPVDEIRVIKKDHDDIPNILPVKNYKNIH